MTIRTIKQKISLLAAVPIIAFVLFAFLFIKGKYSDVVIADTMVNNAHLIKTASEIITEIQKERGKSNLFINGAVQKDEIFNQRKKTDTMTGAYLKSLQEAVISGKIRNEAVRKLSAINTLRTGVDRKSSMNQSFTDYTHLIECIIDTQTAAIRAKTTGGIGKRLAGLALLEEARESAAKLRGLMGGLLSANRPLSESEFNDVMEFRSSVYANLESPALSLSDASAQSIRTLFESQPWTEVSMAFRTIVKNADKGNFGIDSKRFFTTATQQVDDIHNLSSTEMALIEKSIENLRMSAWNSVSWNFGLLVGSILAISFISWIIGRSIARPVAKIAGSLSQISGEMVTASTQISASGKELSDGAAAQAAAVEQTSSSMEEISSMTKLNADNAQKANTLMIEAKQEVDLANNAMESVTRSMVEISGASEEISKIINTIDEIAFQTNLLSLNAAVEAARAGEAGAGFAVVADEVRNLALKASEAAKNTSALIYETVNIVKNGDVLVLSTNEGFKKVALKATKVAELVNEIAAASSEQALGIEQMNQTIEEIDRVVQQNSASAEESAAASEELNTQAEEMNIFVSELNNLVGNKKNGRGTNPIPQLHYHNEYKAALLN